jgi:toxin-antitoxin system PIN domain toxin
VTPYLLDVNVLLALSLDNHMHHLAATEWFDEADFDWATTPLTEAGYVRLMTNREVIGFSVSVSQAVDGLRELRQEPGFRFLPDGTTLGAAVIDLGPLAGTKQVTDFHLVNLVAQSSMRLATFDGALLRSLSESDRGHVFVIDS